VYWVLVAGNEDLGSWAAAAALVIVLAHREV
jgi:hypothetical protein